MIALDTNVLSELTRKTPNPRVAAWVQQQPLHTLYLPSVVVAEMLWGVAILPAGKRRDELSSSVEKLLQTFADRILPLDAAAARCFAALAAKARRAGQTLGQNDAYIAATAQARGCAVASRDVQPYRTAGVEVINPWQ